MTLLRQEVYHSRLTGASTARFDFRSDDVSGKEKIDEDTVDCPRFVCLQRCLTRRQLLKLQSRTADEKNPWRKRRI